MKVECCIPAVPVSNPAVADLKKIYTSHVISDFLLHHQNVDLPHLFSGENKPYRPKLVYFFHPVVTFSVELPIHVYIVRFLKILVEVVNVSLLSSNI